MADEGRESYRFSPHPEAHAMRWSDLAPPVQLAVAELLVRIAGAVQSVKSNDPIETANSFLVHGNRGTGKSTVLLTANAAVFRPNYWEGQKLDGHPIFELVKSATETLRGAPLVWLDVLDLAALPSDTNLLTAMLTRLRNALDQARPDSYSGTTLCYEERAEGARQRLTSLTKKAAITWRQIQEPDTRSSASRDIEASEIYAVFKRLFRDSMKELCAELAERIPGSRDPVHIVLPVDNIDHSPASIADIVKLAQMVSFPNLWLVMSGDGQDIDTFLERAYWQELIKVGEGVGPRKPGVGGEDESVVMARRQAAAALHKLLPESHRIEVQALTPYDALNHCGRGSSRTLRNMLEDIALDDWSGPKISLLNFFDLEEEIPRRKLQQGEKSILNRKPQLTTAAALGLSLPVRTVVDLWNLVNRVKHRLTSVEPAIEVAMTMLNYVLGESAMTNRLVRQLRCDVTQRRHSRSGNVPSYDINFLSPNPRLEIERLSSTLIEYHVPLVAREQRLSSVVSLRWPMQPVLWLVPPRTDMWRPEHRLTDRAAAWLTVLHDGVYWSRKSSLSNDGLGLPNRLVAVTHRSMVTCHEYASPPRERREEVSWPSPGWTTFLAHDRFQANWIGLFRHKGSDEDHESAEQETKKSPVEPPTIRVLPMAWIFLAIDVFVALYGDDLEPNGLAGLTKEVAETDKEHFVDGMPTSGETSLEKGVLSLVGHLHEQLVQAPRPRLYRIAFMREWIEYKVPLLLSHLYVPMEEHERSGRKDAIRGVLPDNLKALWVARAPVILGEIEQELAKLFCLSLKPGEPVDPSCLGGLAIPEPFCDLHRLLKD